MELLTTSNNFLTRFQNVLIEQESHNKILENLQQMAPSETTNIMISQRISMIERCKGRLLGLLKVYYDTLPDSLTDQATINGIPLGLMIKIKLDEDILSPIRNDKHKKAWCAAYLTGNYQLDYQRFLAHISGYGYNFSFNEDRFSEIFPGTLKDMVTGFAESYSLGLQELAKEIDFPIEETLPLEQDIWKNHRFFFYPDCTEYRLDGNYTFQFFEAYTNVPLRDKRAYRKINMGLYDLLKSRPIQNFKRTELTVEL